MIRRRIGIALLVVWAACLGNAPAVAKEKAGTTPLQKAVHHILTRLMQQKKGLHLGAEPKAAIAAAKNASELDGEYRASLAATPYAPPGEWHGVVSFGLTLEDIPLPSTGGVLKKDTELDLMEIVLLTGGKYDRKKMGAFLAKAGKDVGLSLQSFKDAPHVYADPESELDRAITVSLGGDVIHFEGMKFTDE